MKKVFCLNILLLFCVLNGFAQSIEEKLMAHKWALTSYVEVESMQFDTLFKAFDCENGAYIKFNAEQKFEERNKKGDWEIVADSIVYFKNGLGIAYKKI